MNYQEGKGKIHYDLFINQSNRAGETLLNYAPHAKPGIATSWRHFGSLRSALPFLQIKRYKTFILLRIECWYHMYQELLLSIYRQPKSFSIGWIWRGWGTCWNLNSLNVCIPWICLSVVRKIDHTWRNLISWIRLSAMKEWLLQQHLINPFHSRLFFFSGKLFLWSTIEEFSQLHDLFCCNE